MNLCFGKICDYLRHLGMVLSKDSEHIPFKLHFTVDFCYTQIHRS